MIKIPHINGVVSDDDINLIPTIFAAKHSNGNEYLYFDTIIEYNEFLNSLYTEEQRFQSKKEEVKILIDEQTQEKIFSGFIFDGNTFSLSFSAQINLSNIFNIPDDEFPYPYSTLDNKIYNLALTDRPLFYKAALKHKSDTIKNANLLKNMVNNCITQQDLDSIINEFIK